MAFCTKCGYACDEGAKFCARCGNNLRAFTVNPAPAAAQIPVEQVADPAAPASGQPYDGQPAQTPYQVTQPVYAVPAGQPAGYPPVSPPPEKPAVASDALLAFRGYFKSGYVIAAAILVGLSILLSVASGIIGAVTPKQFLSPDAIDRMEAELIESGTELGEIDEQLGRDFTRLSSEFCDWIRRLSSQTIQTDDASIVFSIPIVSVLLFIGLLLLIFDSVKKRYFNLGGIKTLSAASIVYYVFGFVFAMAIIFVSGVVIVLAVYRPGVVFNGIFSERSCVLISQMAFVGGIAAAVVSAVAIALLVVFAVKSARMFRSWKALASGDGDVLYISRYVGFFLVLAGAAELTFINVGSFGISAGAVIGFAASVMLGAALVLLGISMYIFRGSYAKKLKAEAEKAAFCAPAQQ